METTRRLVIHRRGGTQTFMKTFTGKNYLRATTSSAALSHSSSCVVATSFHYIHLRCITLALTNYSPFSSFLLGIEDPIFLFIIEASKTSFKTGHRRPLFNLLRHRRPLYLKIGYRDPIYFIKALNLTSEPGIIDPYKIYSLFGPECIYMTAHGAGGSSYGVSRRLDRARSLGVSRSLPPLPFRPGASCEPSELQALLPPHLTNTRTKVGVIMLFLQNENFNNDLTAQSLPAPRHHLTFVFQPTFILPSFNTKSS